MPTNQFDTLWRIEASSSRVGYYFATMRRERIVVALLIILLPGILLAPVWCLGGLGANEDDILYYYPSRVFFQESVTSGQLPWINPWNGLDRPYVADPQSALWYPFTWLFALLPPLGAYSLSLWAHYSLALWGMYRLLRAIPVDRRAALFGGIIFAFCGFMLAHRAHLAMQHAAAWAPWIFWRLQRFVFAPRSMNGGQASKDWARLGSVCLVAALQCFAGHVQIAALTALGSLVFLLACRSADATATSLITRRTVFTRWLMAWICVAGLFAVQWLPTLAYVQLCTRVDRSYWDFVENSWYPSSTIGWVLPMFFGQRTDNFFGQPYWGPSHQCEQFSYVGLIPLILAALGLYAGWRADQRRRPWVFILIFGLLLSLGLFGPICPLLYWIPGSNLFRVPARGLLLVNLAIAVLAALTLHDFGGALSPRRARLRAVALRWTSRPILTAMLLVVIPLGLIAMALPLLAAETRQAALTALRPWNSAVIVPLVIALVSLITLAFVARQWRQPQWLWSLVLIAALDLGIIGWTIDVPARGDSLADLRTPTAHAWLNRVRDSNQRLWVVTNTAGVYADPLGHVVANTNALVHIQALTDYGPLQPRMLAASFDFTPWGVSNRANELLRDTSWMRAFNVGWILLCESDWPTPTGCDHVTTLPSGGRLYHNPAATGMAFFEQPIQSGAVRFVAHAPDRFSTMIDTWPANTAGVATTSSDKSSWPRLVISRLALPGWQALIDNQPQTIEIADNALLAIRVPPGQAVEIVWSYTPPALKEGALVSAFSIIVLLLLVGINYFTRISTNQDKTPSPRNHS